MKFMFIDDLLWLATVLCELLEGTNRIIYVVRVVDVNKWIFLICLTSMASMSINNFIYLFHFGFCLESESYSVIQDGLKLTAV